MKQLAILGSTGSIGTLTLDVVAAHPERFQVAALAARASLDRLEQQVRRFRPRLVALESEAAADELRRRLDGAGTAVCSGPGGVLRAVTDSGAGLVVSAIVGGAGLRPTMAALSAGVPVALANKESLVMAGGLMTAEARRRGVRILPVDSEHSAIFQCWQDGDAARVRRLVLTASGGPFRRLPPAAFASITPEQALNHPTWAMGRKITIDSATLMNKGLEVIEAHWLFGLPVDRVDVIVHPQSTIHSMVEYVDGSILAQLGVPDMRVPIQYALTYPERCGSPAPRLKLEELAGLTFEPVDRERFPCLDLAYQAAAAGGSAPTVLSAANEIAVSWFLERRIGFDEIPGVVQKALDAFPRRDVQSIDEVLDVEQEVRRRLEAK
ncbi:MAG: 1-deoxy-D-xylulose-5-phosphate reductoisomerase [Candidatus Methylomirabilales bacterium]